MDCMGNVGEGSPSGPDARNCRRHRTADFPSRLPRVVGEAVVGDQRVAGQGLARQPLGDHCHVDGRVEVANVQLSGEIVEIFLGVLRRHLSEGAFTARFSAAQIDSIELMLSPSSPA